MDRFISFLVNLTGKMYEDFLKATKVAIMIFQILFAFAAIFFVYASFSNFGVRGALTCLTSIFALVGLFFFLTRVKN